MKQAPQVLQLCERLNWLATNLRSSARSAKASTSSRALTVRVEEGRFKLGLGIRAQVRSSSPQKSPGRRVMELKKPLRPPLVVELSNRPLITKSISFTGSPSRTINVPCHCHYIQHYWVRYITKMIKSQASTIISNLGTRLY
ncbi:unnamed protein product [Spirodela intermedia]|uniref:Uncharacterized protein n=1 Tax=Spirodela intermedia TaxID=51605 RepID=A0A7I8KFG1_SPIIN|nr:unnamed protein product [Spirodela intermedia]